MSVVEIYDVCESEARTATERVSLSLSLFALRSDSYSFLRSASRSPFVLLENSSTRRLVNDAVTSGYRFESIRCSSRTIPTIHYLSAHEETLHVTVLNERIFDFLVHGRSSHLYLASYHSSISMP